MSAKTVKPRSWWVTIVPAGRSFHSKSCWKAWLKGQSVGRYEVGERLGLLRFPAGTRAIDLPDAYISSYFLKVFGRPERKSACECEREPSVTLAQRAHMLNSSAVTRKMSERAAKMLNAQATARTAGRRVFG